MLQMRASYETLHTRKGVKPLLTIWLEERHCIYTKKKKKAPLYVLLLMDCGFEPCHRLLSFFNSYGPEILVVTFQNVYLLTKTQNV